MPEKTRPRRADAERSRRAIIDAAVEALGADPRASLTEIARVANVSRVTLYGHFASREELLETVLQQTVDSSEADLGAVDLSGDALEALDRLVRTSWRLVDGFHRLLAAAQDSLSNERIVAHHAQPMARFSQLIERGQREGVMRDDLDSAWLTRCLTEVLHAAASELEAGRIPEADADRIVCATVRALVVTTCV